MHKLQALSEQLTTASSLEAVWQMALEETAQWFGADIGAWVWDTPPATIIPLAGSESVDLQAWRAILAPCEASPAAQCWTTTQPAAPYLLGASVNIDAAWRGRLVLGRRTAPFTAEDVELLGSAAAVVQMAATVWTRYADVEQTRLRQVQELETLQQMERLIGESLNLETTLKVILDGVATLIPYDAGEITLFDAEQGVLINEVYRSNTVVQSGIIPPGTIYQLDEGLSGWLARTRQPLLIDDVLTFEAAQPKNTTLKLWARSFLGIPLLARGELVGTLEMAAAVPGQYTEHHKELAMLLGGQAAVAIENARLFAAAQQRVQTLENLREIVNAIGRAGNAENVVREVVSRVAEMVHADVAGLLLYETETATLIAGTPFIGMPEEWVRHCRVALSDPRPLLQRPRDHFYWLIDDAQSDAQVEALGLSPLAVAMDVHQVLCVPLETAGELVGLIQVAKPRERSSFTTEEARALAMLASQIAGTVRISQLAERMEHRTQQLRSLVAATAAVGASLNLDTVLAEIVRTTFDIFKCQRTAIFVVDPVTGLLNLAAAEGVSERYRELSQGIPIVKNGRSHAVATNTMVVSGDVLQEPEPAKVAQLAHEEGFRAFVDCPLHRGDKPVGMLSVQFTAPHSFTDDELSVLRILAEQASIALENARLYTQTDAELRRRLEALEALQRITRDITATIDLDHILHGVLEEAVRFSTADAGLIAVFNHTDFELRVFQGYDEAALEAIRHITSHVEPDSPLAQFLTHQDTIYLPDVAQLPDTSACPPGARTLLVEPVFYEEQLAAAILLQSSRPAAFPPVVLEFIAGLAVQTAIAVGNTRRYLEQLERGELMHKRAEQMSLLLEVSRTMRSDRPLEETLLDIAYAVQEGTGFNIVLISVVEGLNVRRVAGAGIPLARLEEMKAVRHSWPRIRALFQERFRLGRCYYIPAEYYDELFRDIDVFIPATATMVERQPGMWHPKDSFIIPLRGSHGEIVGMMSVDDPMDGRAPTALTAEVIEIFAAQVALAIENNRLFEDLQRQVNTLRLFNELNRSITTKLDLPLVLNTVVQSVTNLLQYDYATIFLQDREGQRFIPLATSGYALELLSGRSFDRGEGAVGTVVQTGMPLVIENTATDGHYQAGPVDIGSSVMVPLMVEGRSVGVLAAERKSKGDFTPTDVATLTALADQVAVAVENARLFEEVKRFSEELELRVAERTRELAEASESLRVQRDRFGVLYQIASELVASLDMDRVLSQALSLLQKAVKASRSAVILLDNNTGQLVYRAAIGHTEPIPPGGRPAPFGRDEGVVGWVLMNRTALIIPNALEDERCAEMIDRMVRSVLAAPIMGGAGESLGVILLQSPVKNVFGESELRLVEAAAVQLGNALNNAELYHLIREQAERLGAMLREQQIEAAKNQAILEDIADGVMVADANGRVILFNAAAERIMSIGREQALGRFQDDILGLYGSAARDWLVQIEKWREVPQDYDADEFLVHRMEVGRRFVSVHLAPVILPSQEFLGVVSVFRDITAEVEADRAKSDFVSTVSHELRTPMTSIIGYVDLILMGATGALSDMQRDFLKKVKTNSERLTNLVNDLLDISRIETGRVVLQLAPVAMEEVVKQVADLLQPKIVEKEQRLALILPPMLPKVYGDHDRLVQIVTNIMGNAHKYTPVGGAISVYVYVREAMLHVAVADTGIGIAPENQKKIFERFYRVENDPDVYEVSGTGLGLAISLSLIQMHGGSISLDSVLGKGSTFTFSVPLAEGELTEDVGMLPPRITEEPRATILVVEDDRESADLLKIMLHKDEVEFLTATSGAEALRIAREKHPDVISLDIRLPDLDGFEVLQLLKRDVETADIPVVIVSVTADRARGLRLGATEHLIKPLNEKRLREVILPLLDRQGTVIVASNDRGLLDPLRTALQLHSLDVHTVRSGERALDVAHTLSPQVLVLDHPLPDMEGYQVLEQLQQDSHAGDTAVIMLTEGMPLTAKQGGAFDMFKSVHFMSKPFSVEELATTISNLIHGNGTLKEL
ncbi:MAG TPA: GAF domain-containing protein [Anaerolineae bacterium]|nr:GAF domain-containing protein [Anaerolineae bacterium]HQH38963.1 GAF domain-containing protein [Anaerolineae bacterium]